MKKATVGLVMLVSLVLIKAYISKDMQENSAELTRSNVEVTSIIKSSNLRADLYNTGTATSNLFAQHIAQPLLNNESEILHVESSVQFENQEVFEDVELQTEIVEVVVDDEIVPMDYFSNTGYGLLKSTTEQIISKKDRIGKEPLDNSSNTISENISKMFPRSH